jgi:hypothetical protein
MSDEKLHGLEMPELKGVPVEELSDAISRASEKISDIHKIPTDEIIIKMSDLILDVELLKSAANFMRKRLTGGE